MKRPQALVATTSLVFGAALISTAWWLLLRSGCAGDVKQGFGDVETALALEERAVIALFMGVILLVFGISVARPFQSKWVQLGVCVFSLQLAYLAFFAMSFLKSGSVWACAL